METIYPQATLDVLAKYDELLHAVIADYERDYPFPPERLRKVLSEEEYSRRCHEIAHQRRSRMLADPIYQACITMKARIISISTYTLRFDAEEVKQMRIGQESIQEEA